MSVQQLFFFCGAASGAPALRRTPAAAAAKPGIRGFSPGASQGAVVGSQLGFHTGWAPLRSKTQLDCDASMIYLEGNDFFVRQQRWVIFLSSCFDRRGKIETQEESFLTNNCLWSHLCWPLGAHVPNGAVFVLTSEIPIQLARGVALIRFGDSDPFLSLSALRQH